MNNSKIDALEFFRGVAALFVVAEHARNFVMLDYSGLKPLYKDNYLLKIFYLFTSFGHISVIVFFVLSGFVMSRSIHNDIKGQNFTFCKYIVSRVIRLWIVLIPALIFTLSMDGMSSLILGTANYSNLLSTLPSGPKIGLSSDVSVFFGNLLFLQSIVMPVFGSNGPLWSLAYEFWYYILFPIIYWPLHKSNKKALFIALASAFIYLIGVFLGFNLLIMMPLWLMGALIFHSKFYLFKWNSKVKIISAFIFFMSVLVSSYHSVSAEFSDLIVALSTGFLVSVFMFHTGPFFELVAQWLGKISFSLYLTHFPFMAFVFSVFWSGEKIMFSETAILNFSILVVASLAIAAAFYQLFERHYPKLKSIVFKYVAFCTKN